MPSPMKAYLIDSAAREIRAVEYAGLADLHKLVGGYIEYVAVRLPPGDTLYVDEDGLSKPQTAFFRFAGYEQPIGGNGVVVGAEIGDTANTLDPTSTVASLTAQVTFLSRAQVDSWAKANASDPGVVFTSVAPDGTVESRTIESMGSLFRNMPRPKDEPTG